MPNKVWQLDGEFQLPYFILLFTNMKNPLVSKLQYNIDKNQIVLKRVSLSFTDQKVFLNLSIMVRIVENSAPPSWVQLN